MRMSLETTRAEQCTSYVAMYVCVNVRMCWQNGAEKLRNSIEMADNSLHEAREKGSRIGSTVCIRERMYGCASCVCVVVPIVVFSLAMCTAWHVTMVHAISPGAVKDATSFTLTTHNSRV